MNSWLCADMYVTPAFFTASAIWSASARLMHIGFSQRMCFPAAAASIIAGAVQVMRQADVDRVDLVAHLLQHDLPVVELPRHRRRAARCAS